MTPAEAQGLLTVAAAFDNRKPDEAAAQAWAMALGDLPFYDCRDSIVRHYQASSEWLMPAKVIADVKRVRAKRIAENEALLTPPVEAREGAAHQAWLADARRRLGDGEPVESINPPTAELQPRPMPDLRALIQKPVRRPVPPPLTRPQDRLREPEPSSGVVVAEEETDRGSDRVGK